MIVCERHISPLIGISLWVQAGARDERPGEDGCAHFLEHTLFKGTITRHAGDVDIAIENVGAVLDAATGPDYAHYYTTVSAMHLSTALEVMSDVVKHATLPEQEVQRERNVILDELAQHDADPTSHLVDLIYASAYPGLPYSRSPGGSQDAIRALQRKTLLAFYHRCYTPSRCAVVLVGDCTQEQAHREVEKVFGDWIAADTPRSTTLSQGARAVDQSTISSVPNPSRAPVEVRWASHHAMVGIGFPTPPARDVTMTCAGMLIAALLGEPRREGRLDIPALTETEASARYTPRRDPGLLILTANIPESKPGAKQTDLDFKLMQVIRDLNTNPPGRGELSFARRIIYSRLQFDTETNGGLARALGYAAIVGGETPDELRARLRRVTPSDIMRYCQRYLNPANATTIHLIPTTDITSLRPPADTRLQLITAQSGADLARERH